MAKKKLTSLEKQVNDFLRWQDGEDLLRQMAILRDTLDPRKILLRKTKNKKLKKILFD